MLRLTHARDGGTERKKRKKTLLRARLSRGVYRGIGNIVVHAIRASLGGYCVIADLLAETSRFGFSCRRRVVLIAIRRVTAGYNACATRFDYHPGKIRRLEKGREKRETERGSDSGCRKLQHLHGASRATRAKEREEKETGNMIKRGKKKRHGGKKGAPPLVVKLINDMSHPVVVIIVGNLISANQHAA